MSDAPIAAVIGAINIDILVQGLPHFAEPGEQVNGPQVQLRPGGKARNIASMLTHYLENDGVALVARLVMDTKGLHHVLRQSLEVDGIDTENLILDGSDWDALPTLSIFLNTRDRQSASYYLPGDNETMSPADLDTRRSLFEQISILIMTLEIPIPTACHALKMAQEIGLKVMLDPGGQPPEKTVDFSPLFDYPIYALKANAAEAERLTGIPVTDFQSAQQAAQLLMEKGVENVLITHGKHGGYAFTPQESKHIRVSEFDDDEVSPLADATGCGDQVMAVLAGEYLWDKDFMSSAEVGIEAGTLQYRQPGLVDLSWEDIYPF
jgi:ribokinase